MYFWKIFIFILLFVTFPCKVLAVSEFGTSYQAHYNVSDKGLTNVEMRVLLRNRISNIYADKFSLSVGFTNLKNVKVRDQKGLLEHQVERTENQTTISFSFVDKIVGKDKVNNFVVSFETEDVAVKNGAIWEVNIPPLEADKDVESHSVILDVPAMWGEPANIAPPASKIQALVGTRRYTFDNVNLGNQPISAVFGKTQFVSFKVNYGLENLSPSRVIQEVALIPNTNYQEVMYDSIIPSPDKVKVDMDGNWIASFVLEPSEKMNVSAVGVVKVNFSPTTYNLSLDQVSAYLAPSSLWQTENEQIKELAEKLRTPEAIFDYVTDKLSYDYSKIQTGPKRMGAVYALENPLSAICTEFTDLFVAISRAAGIPARELEGYAFTNNEKLRPLSLSKDVLHAWPEYYDVHQQRFVQVDPTWTVTTGGVDYFHKLDLNHLVFAIHGQDPIEPYPVGAYKIAGSDQKDIDLIPVEPIDFPKPQVKFDVKSNTFRNKLVLIVSNVGQVAASPSISVDGTPLDIIDYQAKLSPLAPGEVVEVELPIAAEKGIGLVKSSLVVNYDDKEARFPFTYRRKTPATAYMAGLVTVAGASFAVTKAARGLYLRRRRKETNIYW